MANASIEHLDAVETASTGAHTETAHADPTVFGLNATGWTSVAMILVILIMLWKKVPAVIAAALDKRIAQIREEIDEAAKLREEAEALKAEYEAKTANADKEAEAVLDRARHEAGEILEEAEANANSLVERRQRLAEEKIAAAERSAVHELRARAATAATAAAAKLIEEKHGAEADRALIDRTISGLN